MKQIIAAITLFLAINAYGGDGTQLTTRLESIVIPELTIMDQPINEALNNILAACAKTQTNQWVPGVILNLGDTPEHSVSLQAINISVLEALQRIGSVSGLIISIEENAVVIKPEKRKSVEQAGAGYPPQGVGSPDP